MSNINVKDEKKYITLDLWKAIAILGTAIIGSAGAGIWGSITTINSDHFAIVAATKDIQEIRATYMPLDLSLEKWKNNDENHNKIEKKLDDIYKLIQSTH